jgi:hypothetical protein
MPTFRQSGYRWTNQFFDKDLRLIPDLKPKVLAKFEEYSGLKGENLRRAFLPGYIPAVRVVHLPGLYGFTPPISDEIQLAKTFIEELEAALPSNKVPRGHIYAPSELETNLLWILEATVLHEMVHFFRRKFNDTAQLNSRSASGRAYEEAWARRFEKEAYGKLYTVQSLFIDKYMPKTAAASK